MWTFARVRIAYQPPRVPAAALVVDQVVHRPAVVKARLVGDLPDGLITLNGSVLGELDPDSQWLCHYVSSISVNRSNGAFHGQVGRQAHSNTSASRASLPTRRKRTRPGLRAFVADSMSRVRRSGRRKGLRDRRRARQRSGGRPPTHGRPRRCAGVDAVPPGAAGARVGAAACSCRCARHLGGAAEAKAYVWRAGRPHCQTGQSSPKTSCVIHEGPARVKGWLG